MWAPATASSCRRWRMTHDEEPCHHDPYDPDRRAHAPGPAGLGWTRFATDDRAVDRPKATMAPEGSAHPLHRRDDRPGARERGEVPVRQGGRRLVDQDRRRMGD